MIRTMLCSIAVFALAAATPSRASEIHRVVTGLDAQDRSTTLFDSTETLTAGASGLPSKTLWITDSYPPGFTNEDAAKRKIGITPPDNGTKILEVEFPPLNEAALAKMDPNFMMKVVGDKAPKRGVAVSNPLEHRTRTLDYAIILSGEVDMLLDDSQVHLKPGDVVIQQGTNHAWVNCGAEPCRIAFILIDAKD